MQVPVNQCAGIVIYLLAITGISLFATKLSSVVAEQASVLALPYLDDSPPKLSLIERRRIEAMQAAQPLPEGARRRVAALEAPSAPAGIFAARLDLAEREDGLETAASTLVTSYSSLTGPGERSRVRIKHSMRTDLSAGDIFNRSFGVLTVAAN